MNPEIKAGLEKRFQERNTQKQALQQRASEESLRRAKNIVDFQAAKESVIRPALQEIVDMFRSQGLPARIEEQDETQRPNGGTINPYIRLSLEQAQYSSATMREEFTLYFSKENRELSLHTSTHSQSGPAGSRPLDSISSDWIQAEFLKYDNKR